MQEKREHVPPPKLFQVVFTFTCICDPPDHYREKRNVVYLFTFKCTTAYSIAAPVPEYLFCSTLLTERLFKLQFDDKFK